MATFEAVQTKQHRAKQEQASRLGDGGYRWSQRAANRKILRGIAHGIQVCDGRAIPQLKRLKASANVQKSFLRVAIAETNR
jgi:hypothetical protein